jgi:hypothetical protein
VARIREPGAPGDRSDDSLRVQLIDARTFPVLRPKRVLGVKTAIDPTLEALMDTTGELPRPRVFPWDCNTTTGTRRTFSTPRLLGPVMITGLSYEAGAASTPPTESFEIGYANVSVRENNVALGTLRPYTVLTELRNEFNDVAAATGSGILSHTPGTSVRNYQTPLRLIITEPEVFVTVSIVNNGPSTFLLTGILTLIEQLSRKALESYIPGM